MKQVFRWALLLLLAMSQAAGAATLTVEQKSVMAFIKKMYSYGAGKFEYGYFSGVYKPKDHCALLFEFFTTRLVDTNQRHQGCDVGLYIRYPNVGSEDLSENLKPGQMPAPNFSALKVEGDKAAVTAVTNDYGRVRFYLIKTDKGWRIDNAMYDLIWPIRVHEKCGTNFLRKPTRQQFKDAPASCQRDWPDSYLLD